MNERMMKLRKNKTAGSNVVIKVEKEGGGAVRRWQVVVGKYEKRKTNKRKNLLLHHAVSAFRGINGTLIRKKKN